MNWTVILGILGIVLILYLLGALRVLRQYERGVVFLLGKFESVRGPGLTLIFIPDGARIFAHGHDANPVAENHYQGQRLDRHRSGRLLSYFRSGKGGNRH